MSMVVVANLGDATLGIPSGSFNTGGPITIGGFIWVNNMTGAPITFNLIAALSPFVMLKDVAGNANAHPITIASTAGIDSGTTIMLALSYQWVWLAWNGSSYSVIG